MEPFDVVVIGGGTAGLVTASGCARLGRKVALIEREALGGDCLWTGCVPTKALVSTAKLAHQMRNAAAWGLEPVTPRVTPKSIMESMREQRRTISRHDDPRKFRDLGIDVIEGSATLLSQNEVGVGERVLHAKDIVIATGARTAVPPVEGLLEHGFLDHASFLDQDDFPPSLLILGGGYIGIEFAQIFARFGTRVTVVEMLDEIVAKEDAAIIASIRRILAAEGVDVITGWAVRALRRERDRKVATIEDGTGGSRELEVDEIFVASGRRGNTENLGLENAGVAVDRSWIKVDKFLQTSVPRIWACGDVHGGLQFTHVAGYEAVKLVRNMLFPGKSPVDYSAIPCALYIDPELARIGMTEADARARYGDDAIRVYEIEMADVDRAVVDRTSVGMIKFVCDRKGRILGAHALCATASTVIAEVVLARKNGLKISDLAQRISPYPSLADGVQKAAAQFYEELGSSWVGTVGRRLAKLSQ